MKYPNVRSRKEQRHIEQRHLRYLANIKKNAIAEGQRPPQFAIKEAEGLMKR